MSVPRIFRRSDGLVVHLLVPGYQQGRKGRSPQLIDVQSLCGTSAWKHRNGLPVDVELPLPAHLRWCANCIGREAERLGVIDRMAAELLDGAQ